MKTFISAVALAAILSTPAMAKSEIKPVDTCGDDLLQEVVMYHLAQIDMLMEEMRQDILQEYPKPKFEDKPVDDNK